MVNLSLGIEIIGVVTLVAVGEPQGQDRDCFLVQALPPPLPSGPTGSFLGRERLSAAPEAM